MAAMAMPPPPPARKSSRFMPPMACPCLRCGRWPGWRGGRPRFALPLGTKPSVRQKTRSLERREFRAPVGELARVLVDVALVSRLLGLLQFVLKLFDLLLQLLLILLVLAHGG